MVTNKKNGAIFGQLYVKRRHQGITKEFIGRKFLLKRWTPVITTGVRKVLSHETCGRVPA
jgi:hypothetical protein